MAITYEQARKEAEKSIEEWSQIITEVVELDDSWIFLGGRNKRGEIVIGGVNVKVYKETGKLDNYPIPPMENLHNLKKGVVIFKL